MVAPQELHRFLDALYKQVDPGEMAFIVGLVSVEPEAERCINRSVIVTGPDAGQVRTFLLPQAAGEELLGAIQARVTEATPPDAPPS